MNIINYNLHSRRACVKIGELGDMLEMASTRSSSPFKKEMAMWWEKKDQPVTRRDLDPVPAPPPAPKLERPMTDNKPTSLSTSAPSQKQTCLGPSMALHGELSGDEDLLIEGRFEGTIKLPDHCLTVGSQGQVKAEVHARHVIVFGSVTGNISARERVEVRKSGQIVGDLVAAGVAIEEGAYLKGSIDIQRGDTQSAPRTVSAPSALKTSA